MTPSRILAQHLRTPADRRRAAAALSRTRLVHLLPAAAPVPPAAPAAGPPLTESAALGPAVATVAAPARPARVSGAPAAPSETDPGPPPPVPEPGEPPGPAEPLPDGWPHGYGKRSGPRHPPPRSTAAAAAAAATAAAAAPATGPGPGSTPEPLVKPDRVRAPGVVADTHPHPPRRRFRLPAALHPLLWADRKAVLGLGVLLLLAVAYAVQHFWLGRPQPVAVPAITGKASRSAVPAVAPAEPAGEPGPEDPSAPEPGHPAASEVVIDVAGRVLQPGVRALPAGSRVADALRAAGGPQPGVDTDGLNLARVLVDGEQVLVGLPVQAGGGSGQSATRGPVSINRATAEQLDALPGIGPVLARHILDFRTQHGSFRSLDQLRQISGIGERKYAELKLLLTL